MASKNIEDVVVRLEKVATILEDYTNKSCGGGQNIAAFIDPFKEILTGPLAEFINCSKGLHSDVEGGAQLLEKSFNATLDLLMVASVSKKPDNDKLPAVLKPLVDSIEALKKYCDSKFKSEFKAHLESVSSFSAALGWISAPMRPQAFITEAIDSGMFYSNRVLTSFKDKGPVHKQWVASLIKLFKSLSQYAEDYHSSGFAWNSKGGVASATAAASATTAVPKAVTKTSAPAAADPSALFSALNKGSNITSGLKKVADTEKTHKNPSLRAGAVVPDEMKPKATTTTTVSAAASATVDKPPVLELQGKKWAIECQKNQEMLEITEGDISYTVSMWKCVNTNVKISPKINTITMDSCVNCKIQIVSGLISVCDLINCKKVEVHADDKVPFVNVNNTHGCQVYLNEKSTDAKISTATSTSVNVCTWSKDTDLTEHAVPYQFVSYFKDNKLVTEVADDI